MSTIEVSLYLWNLIVFFVYGADKLLARQHARRISERTLLTSAALCGGLGALFGMVVFNHKTSKPKFRYIVPLLAILCLMILQYRNYNLLELLKNTML